MHGARWDREFGTLSHDEADTAVDWNR